MAALEPETLLRAESILRRAAMWLAEFGAEVRSVFDEDLAAPILFGIGCALGPRGTAPSADRLSAIRRGLADQLAAAWTSRPRDFYLKFASGGFVRSMMAAAVLEPNNEATKAMQHICQNAWQAVEASGVLDESPTLLWTGRRLFAAIGGDTPGLMSSTWWESEISNLTPPHLVSAAALQQMIADLAAMSAYGAFAPPLPRAEREYLRDTMPCLTFFYVKERDLEMVNSLLRGLRYAGMTDVAEFGEALRFVFGRSRSDGRFTMRDLATHLQALSSGATFDVQRTIHLPLTVGSVWTLCECLSSAGPFVANAHGEANDGPCVAR